MDRRNRNRNVNRNNIILTYLEIYREQLRTMRDLYRINRDIVEGLNSMRWLINFEDIENNTRENNSQNEQYNSNIFRPRSNFNTWTTPIN